jgi:hypothetical protein
LTQFACVFSALIRRDHTGVPNSQLIKENSALARIYKDKSVAEQNSVDLCWDLLMDGFDKLRAAITVLWTRGSASVSLLSTPSWLLISWTRISRYFRNNRWAKAFSDDARGQQESKERRTENHHCVSI